MWINCVLVLSDSTRVIQNNVSKVRRIYWLIVDVIQSVIYIQFNQYYVLFLATSSILNENQHVIKCL